LPTYIETFLDHKAGDDELGYSLAGQDFVIDVLGFIDIFKPFSELMILTQSLSISPWRIVSLMQKLMKYVDNMYDDLKEKKIDNFPNLLKYINEIRQFKFKGAELEEGWSICSVDKSKQKTNWIKRELNDCIKDFRDITSVLKAELKYNYQTRIAPLLKSLNSALNLSDLFIDASNNEAYSNTFGSEIINFVKSLPQVKSKYPSLFLDSSCFTNLLNFFRKCLEIENRQLLNCFIKFNEDFEGKIVRVSRNYSHVLNDIFNFHLDNSNIITGIFDEDKLLCNIYENSAFYGSIGQEMCIVLDVMYAKCGTETIAESFYRVMESQRQSGSQSNVILELRTKLDWSLPNVTQCDQIIEAASSVFFQDGEKTKKHFNPISVLGGKNKVLTRFEQNKHRLPFVIN